MEDKVNIQVTIPYFDQKEMENIKAVLESGWVAQGVKVAEFEEKVAKHEGVSYAIATTSCTTALHLALAASGVKEGNDVLVPAFTFVATANAVVETGATPILIDIEEDSFNIDPKKIKEKICSEYEQKSNHMVNRKTGNILWGIVPVHQFGLCCEINEINEIAKMYNLKVIEDAACALGAKVKDTYIGGFGNIACISFHPRKSITTGEGGMILTDDENLEKKMKELRSHGSTVSAEARHTGKGFLLPAFKEAGYNYRMTDIQAAMGLAQMEKLDYIISEKRKKVEEYNKKIQDTIPELIPPIEPDGYTHTYQSYVCMLNMDYMKMVSVYEAGDFRNSLLEQLEEEGIATRQGTHAVHMLDYYKQRFGYQPEMLYNAFRCDRLSITLPLFVQMTLKEQDYVIVTIRKVLDRMLEQ